MKIPELYETENIDFPYKIIHEKWMIQEFNYYWFIAEYSPDKDVASGYANLDNDLLAEWGYIDMKEVRDAGAEKVEYWKPRPFLKYMVELDLIRKLDCFLEQSDENKLFKNG
jgi:hypothetical protein